MIKTRRLLVTAILLSSVVAGMAAISRPRFKQRNLKVLPQDISDQKLDSIMNKYSLALGVDCNFCHQPPGGFSNSVDFSADVNPMKENARDMMRMVIDINKRYFYFDTTRRPEYLHTITCNNCHRGQPVPPENH